MKNVLVVQVCVGPQGRLVLEGNCNYEQELEMRSELPVVGVLHRRMRAGRKKWVKDWTPEENKKFYDLLHNYGSDFQMMETMFGGRTRDELKNKFKHEEKTWKSKEPGLKAWEGDDLILQEEVKVVKSKKKKPRPRRRYKNKGFYESSSGEDSDAEEKPVKIQREAASRVAHSKKVGQRFPRIPVLMHMKQEEALTRTAQEAEHRKLGGFLHLLDPYGIPATN